jgi:hypothetical protein
MHIRKEVISMADKRQDNCGCGCVPPLLKKTKPTKAEAEKPKKAK